MGIVTSDQGQGGAVVTLSKKNRRMSQRLLIDNEDHEDNEYNEEYAEEPPKEGLGCVMKIFLILLFIVAIVLVLIPSLIPVFKSIHDYNNVNQVDTFVLIEDYQNTIELQAVALTKRSNSDPLRTGSKSELLKKTGSNSESWITKFISDLSTIPWWVYAVVIVVFVVMGLTVWRTCLCLGDVLLAGWVLTRARNRGY